MTSQTRIAAVNLAGGLSRRSGSRNKLLLSLSGKPLIAHVADAALASVAEPVIVVTGHDHIDLMTALEPRPLQYVHNSDYRDGQASSVRCGIDSLSDDVNGALICLGDMPLITAVHLDILARSFIPGSISVPVSGDRRGNPVLFPASCFDALSMLRGDTGGRAIISGGSAPVIDVEIADNAIFHDVDRLKDLDKLLDDR